MPRIANITVSEQTFRDMAMTAALPDIPIIDTDGRSVLPSADLPGFIARYIGLDPATLTAAQKAAIRTFIADYTL